MPEPNKDEAAQGAVAAPAQAAVRERGKPTGWRKWAYRLAAMTLVPTLAFGLLELTLRVSDFGYPTEFFLDGSEIEEPGTVVDNPDFGRWVFPRGLDRPPQPAQFAFAAVKPANTYRVFVLGESAAMGFPDPTTSFARVLEVMLRAAYPEKRIEVINTSMVAINSHVVLPIARRCAQREPDLLVVHLGNNEVVGPYGAAGVLGPYSPSLGVIRTNLAVKRTRTGQMLDRLMQWFKSDSAGSRKWEGLAMFRGSQVRADDSRLATIRAHFVENLDDICRAGADAGVPVIVCTIPVNLRDCAPFASLHSAELAADALEAWEKSYKYAMRLEEEKKFAEASRLYEAAAHLDDQFADLAFRRGRCAEALGKSGEARDFYEQARDLDALRLRSDSAVNQRIRVAVARGGSGIHLADLEKAFAQSSPAGAPGEDLFFEHVHMNFHGNYEAARTIFQTLAEMAPPALGPRTEKPVALNEQACAERLGHTDSADLGSQHYIQRMFEKPPFTDQLDHAERERRWRAKVEALQTKLQKDGLKSAVARVQKAVEGAPDDWMLRLTYANLLSNSGDVPGATRQYRAALHRLHHCYPAHAKLGALALRAGRNEEALEHFQLALQMAPDFSEATYGLARTLAAQGKIDEACVLFEREVAKEVDQAGALVGLGIFLQRVGKPKEANERFREALKVDPSNATAHVRLGDAALKQGETAAALEHYEAAVRLRPELRELNDRIAKLRKKDGKPD